MNRRNFIKTAAAGLLIPAAPAIVRADWLMPVKPVAPQPYHPPESMPLGDEKYSDPNFANIDKANHIWILSKDSGFWLAYESA